MDDRRKRLLYRACHRGMKEADIFVGGFAQAHLEGLTEEQLGEFEAIIDLPDNDLWNWLTHRDPVPAEHSNSVMDLLMAFRLKD